MIKENKITGSPVPRAKIGGRSKPSEDFKTKGIKAPKNKTPAGAKRLYPLNYEMQFQRINLDNSKTLWISQI